MVFQVTRNLWVGRYVAKRRVEELRRRGMTHILNVGETPNQISDEDGPFRKVLWRPIEDLQLIPTNTACECLDQLHACVCEEGSHVYVHCMAGWNRSPTILWLYLVACGVDEAVAKAMICEASYDAVPGHGALVDADLIARIKEHGARNFTPHRRAFALERPGSDRGSSQGEAS